MSKIVSSPPTIKGTTSVDCYETTTTTTTPARTIASPTALISSTIILSSSESYQQSPRGGNYNNHSNNHNMSGSSGSPRGQSILQKIMDNTFRRLSIEQGYEQPGDHYDDEDNNNNNNDNNNNNHNAEETTNARRAKRAAKQQERNKYPYHCPPVLCRTSLVFGILAICFLWGYIQTLHDSHYGGTETWKIYTGDNNDDAAAARFCGTADTGELPTTQWCRMQQLKSFSTIRDMEHGVVAADHPKCSDIGLAMMRDRGGNAVDAAVATALCLGVANPSSSGIGGGAFILIHAEDDNASSTRQKQQRPQPKFHDARTATAGGDQATTNNKITEVIDCREVAGEKYFTMMYQQPPKEEEGEGSSPSSPQPSAGVDVVDDYASIFGGLAVAVPGELRGLELAHARHGRLEWATVVRPAMLLARDGVPVYHHLAEDIATYQSRQEEFGGFPTLRPLLTHDDDWNHILKEGDLIKNPTLADTLRAVMEDGADALYRGHRALGLAKDIQQAGGILTQNDIENYYPTLRSPVVSDSVFGFHVVGVPPPSSGGAAIIGALRFLAGYATPLASFADTLAVHRMAEALKHVFAIRMSMGDPAFPLGNPVTNATTQDAVDALIQGPYMEMLREATLDDQLLNLSHYGGPKFAQLNDTDGQVVGHDAKEGDRRRRRKLLRVIQEEATKRNDRPSKRRLAADPFGYLNDHGTSHLSVVDADGNACAITTSVNAQFGAALVSETTGVLLNNQMNDFGNPGKANFFGLRPSEANFIEPGKKPLSSMSPTMVFQTRQPDGSDDASSSGASSSLGDLRMVLGGSGGPKIISAIFQVMVNYLLLGKPLFESMAHPRMHNQLLYHGTASTTLENSKVDASEINLRVSNRTKSALLKRGHQLLDINYAGTVQAVAVDSETGKLTAVCDIRKGGSPVGY